MFNANHNPFNVNLNPEALYHGSPIEIDDRFIASGTYFTDDIEVAKEYGKYIYSIKVSGKIKEIMQLDCLGEHYISTRLIPIQMFEISTSEKPTN